MTRCGFLLDPTTGEARRHLERWRKLSYHILTFQPFARFPSQTGNVYLNTAVSSMFRSQVKSQRCPLLPHAAVRATTSLWVRRGPPPACGQDGEKGPHVRVRFHLSPLFQAEIVVGEELHLWAPFVLGRVNATSVYSVLRGKCFVSGTAIHFLSSCPLSVPHG